MCRNATCQNDYSANLLENNFLCATQKFIWQLNDKVNMLHAWTPQNLEVALPQQLYLCPPEHRHPCRVSQGAVLGVGNTASVEAKGWEKS